MFGHQISPYFRQGQFGLQSRDFIQTFPNGSFSSRTMNSQINVQQGFIFRRKTEKIDWRKLASIDVDYIVRNVDFEALQDILLNITFCNIESEIVDEHIDPNFIKLFKLSQLIVEYLLQSQEYIFANIQEISQELAKEKEENLKLRNEDIVKLQNQISEMKKEMHNRRHIIAMQQHIIQNGRESVNKCSFCPKTFMSPQLLQSHIYRRHVDTQSTDFEPNIIPADSQKQNKFVDEELENKLERMREDWQMQFKQNLQELSDRLKRTEERNVRSSAQKEEKYDDKGKTDFDLQKQLDIIKEEHKIIYESELKRMQTSFMKELKDMNEKQRKITDELERLKETRIGGSMIGNLEDDVDGDLLEEKKREMELMKIQFNKDLKAMQLKLEKQLEKKYKEKLNQMEEANKLKLKQFIKEAEETKKIMQFHQKLPGKNIIQDIEIFENSLVPSESEQSETEDTINKNINYKENKNVKNSNNDVKTEKIAKLNAQKKKDESIQTATLLKPEPPVRVKKKSKVISENKIVIPQIEKGKSNPDLLALAKAELDMRLEGIRIPKTATQLPDTHISSINNLIGTYRTDIKQKYPDFDNFREKCVKVVNQKSKKFIEHILSKKVDTSLNVSSKQVNFSSTLPPRTPIQSASKHLESSAKAKAISLQDLNQPSSKPQKTISFGESTKPTELSNDDLSIDDDDDEDIDDNDDDDDVDDDVNDDVDDQMDDDNILNANQTDDEDSISNIDMTIRSKDRKVEFKEKNLSIKEKTKLIENQLQTRASKKPAGAIDLIIPDKVSNVDTKKIIDDDAFSITDISYQEPEKPMPKPRFITNVNSSNKSNREINMKIDDAGSWDESD